MDLNDSININPNHQLLPKVDKDAIHKENRGSGLDVPTTILTMMLKILDKKHIKKCCSLLAAIVKI